MLFNNTCEWRKLAIQLLDQHEISWTAVLSSGGVTGLVAGIEAGLGVSVFPEKGLPHSMKEVGKRYNLPILPQFEYRLFESRLATAAARRLAFAMRDVFGHEEIRPAMS